MSNRRIVLLAAALTSVAVVVVVLVLNQRSTAGQAGSVLEAPAHTAAPSHPRKSLADPESTAEPSRTPDPEAERGLVRAPSPPSESPSTAPSGPVDTQPPRAPTERPGPTDAPPRAGSTDGGVRYPINRDGIRAAVREGIPGIRECYEEWLKVQPNLGGRLKVTFTIDTDDGVAGKVERVSLGDAGMGHLAMEGCILSVFQDLRFEAPLDGPVNVTYPIALSSSPDAGR